MANKNVQGISIVLGADASELATALNKTDKSLAATQNKLKEVNKALKLNPDNIDLLRQKEELLTQKINDTKSSIDNMKAALNQMDEKNVSRTSEEYMRLQRSIIEAESKQEKFNQELQELQIRLSTLGQLGAKFEEIGSKLTALGNKMKTVSLYAAAVATSIGAMAYSAATGADDINTMSKVTGIATDDLQLYARAADLVDVSVSAIGKAQTKLKKSMLSAAEGSASAATAFEMLGVNVENADGSLRDQDEVFQEVLASLGQMTNETERDAYAMSIFGKSASELNPLIEDMGETYSMVAQMFKDNNIEIVDQETLDGANRFNDAIDKIKATVSQAVFVIGAKLADYLAPLMDRISEKIQAVAGYIANLNPRIVAIVGAIASVVAAAAPLLLIAGQLSTAIGGILPKLSPLITLLTANPFLTAAVAIGGLSAAFVALGGNIDTLASTISEKLTAFVNAFVEMIPQVVAVIGELIPAIVEAIATNLPQIIEGGAKIILALIDGLIQSIPTLVSNIPQIIIAVVTALDNLQNEVFRIGANVISGLWQGMQSKIAGLIQKVSALAETIKTKLKNAFDVNSPSRWARDMIGKNIVLGMAQGISGNARFIDKAMAAIVPNNVPTLGTISNSMSDAVGTALALGNSGNNSGGEFKFNIELDGARVAEKIYKTSSRGEMIMVG